MAKEIKTNPYLLFLIGTVLLVAGWLMKSFPLFIFGGLAPLFAITDHTKEDNIWNKLELVGVAIVIALFAGHVFETGRIIPVLIQSILLTIAFVAFSFTRQSLGPRLGKLPLVFFWLGLEYFFLKLHFEGDVLFLGDSLQLKASWLRWTERTGYLGTSAWILISNLFLYHGLFKQGIHIHFLILFLIVVAGPIVYSYTLESNMLTRTEMSDFYSGNDPEGISSYYRNKGEWLPRTAAWISVLIILFAFVKNNIRKK